MSKDTRPNDLISTTEAAKIAERSERTIRRWTQPEVQKLGRWLGEPPVKGGAASVLVSKRELMVLLAVSGQEPRSEGDEASESSHAVSRDMLDSPADRASTDVRASVADISADVRVAVLEERLKAAELQAQLASVMAERDGLNRQLNDLRMQSNEQQRRADDAHRELRSDLHAERERVMALEFELKAVRGLKGVSLWQRLLGGPVATRAIPEAK